MLPAVAVVLVATGLPAFATLIGISVAFAIIGLLSGSLSPAWLNALPLRVFGLLENDLLQALPLYVLMGALLNRLPLADILFRGANRALARTPAAPHLSAIGLGALLAPMSGSVGASVAMLAHVVHPRLVVRGVPSVQSLAIVCVASTLGVVVPPSLVLILLGDAMLRAHTEAVNATGQMTRIINTQDVFLGALPPAAIFVVLCLGLAWWRGHRNPRSDAAGAVDGGRLNGRERIAAVVTPILILILLGAVTIGYLYAVEAAATGALFLFVAGVATRKLNAAVLRAVLIDTMAVTGALFALLVAATTFTLVFRAFDSDRALAAIITTMPGGATGAVTAVLLMLALCALVLDAFEIIFVVIPIVMPALLLRVPDAVWVSVLTMLVLQASFLLPPVGYAVMMARTRLPEAVPLRTLVKELRPFLLAQLAVFALTIGVPGLTHWLQT
jgi:tripartite ATP-independent transporter DctM subunit